MAISMGVCYKYELRVLLQKISHFRHLFKKQKPRIEFPDRYQVNDYFELGKTGRVEALARQAANNSFFFSPSKRLHWMRGRGPVSFFVVRHPLERLVSAYLQRLVQVTDFRQFFENIIR